MKKCVVLGGRGFIGRYICLELVRTGYDVVSVGRTSEEGCGRYKQVVADLFDVDSAYEHLRGADQVICLAPSSVPATANEDLSAEIRAHVEATLRLAECAASTGVANFIFASSGGTVYGDLTGPITEGSPTDPIGAYGVSKLAIENYLRVLSRHSDMKTVSLRISNPYGVGQNARRGQGFIAAVLNSYIKAVPLTIWGDGTAVRDFLHVKDVARAVRHALEYRGNCSMFNIGSSVGVSLNEVISEFQEITSSSINVLYQPKRKFDVQSNVLDIDLAMRELQWTPEISLKPGLNELISKLTAQSIAA